MSDRPTIVALLLAVACTEKPATHGEDASSDGPDGTAGVSGVGGGGAAPNCFQSSSMIAISVEPSPLDGGTGEWVTAGVITAKDKTSFVVDSCAPSMGCAPSLTTVTVDAVGVDTDLHVGAYVRVRYQTYAYNNGQVAANLSVANLPSWDGKPNPISAADVLEFFATEGALKHPDLPFEVSSTALDCAPPPGGKGTSYKVLFRISAAEPWVAVHQNEAATLSTSNQKWKVAVVRAFQLYGFDRPDPFAWWAAAATQ